MSSTVAESSSPSPATSPTVSVGPVPSAASSGPSSQPTSVTGLSSPASVSSGTSPAPSTPMSSQASSELPPVTSTSNPTPSPSPSPTSVPSTNPPMSSATTPPNTSQSDPPSPSTSNPPPTTSQPPPTTSQLPSTTLPASTSQPPETTSQPPSTTNRPPSTSSTPPPETSSQLPDTTTVTRTTTPSQLGESSSLVAVSTYQSTVFLTTTDEHGSTLLSAPSAFTSTLVSTNSMGQAITVTQIINNPTLLPNGSHGSASAFFQNKGAVAGVFVVVGLAATAIVFFILFWFRRRRKTRRLDHDTVVAATLAEHGYGRHSLIDADDRHPASDPRTTSMLSGSTSSGDMRRTSTPSMTLSALNAGLVSGSGYGRQPHNPPYFADSLGQTYNPYAESQLPYQNANPGPSNSGGAGGVPYFSLPSVPGVGRPSFGHHPEDSAGSSEPLLGVNSGGDSPPEPGTPAIPPRNPLRLVGGGNRGNDGQDSGGYEDDDTEREALGKRSLRVRNNPD